MKLIPTEFTKRGISYKQLARSGSWAVYEQRDPNWSRSFFEVVKIQCHDGYEIAGNDIPAAEFYPRSEDWGVNGFTCHTAEQARIKMEQMSILGR